MSKEVDVELALVNGSFSLSVGKEISIPLEFWKYETEFVNESRQENKIWASVKTAEDTASLTGRIRCFQKTKDDGDYTFAGIETVSVCISALLIQTDSL